MNTDIFNAAAADHIEDIAGAVCSVRDTFSFAANGDMTYGTTCNFNESTPGFQAPGMGL